MELISARWSGRVHLPSVRALRSQVVSHRTVSLVTQRAGLCVCVCVFMCVCVCVCRGECLYACVRLCVYVCLRACICMCV